MTGKLSAREKRLVSILIVLILVMVFYQFIWQVQYPRYTFLRGRLQTEAAKLDRARETASTLQDVQARRRETEARLAAVKLHFTTDLKGGTPVVEMSRRLEGVELLGVYPKDIIEEDSYMVLPLDLKVRGTYVDILGFIQAMESLPQAVSIQALGLSGGEPANETTDAGNLAITADMKLAFYGVKEGPAAKVGGDWTLGRFDIFSPALQDLLDATRNSDKAKPPGNSQREAPKQPSHPPNDKAGVEAVLPKNQQTEEDPYSFPVK
ncbi:hypothetical protein SY88_11420 [Clostridiales bacterium PH28_bin88]|nr:hypothetical protein SY88_11420 [Clostridiales bacterium PH28_bin88]